MTDVHGSQTSTRATAADEWRGAFRGARNAAIAWAALGVTTLVVATQQTDDDVVAVAAGVIFFASAMTLYGVWRLWRLLVIRRDLAQGVQDVGRVYVALFTLSTPRWSSDSVAVWLADPRTNAGRSRRPDRAYVAEFSESERTDSFHGAVVREAWTPVGPDGRPRGGRWFRTADNLVLTARPGGPLTWLGVSRGLPNLRGVVPVPAFDPSEFSGLDRPAGFHGLGKALLWRFVGMAVLAVYVYSDIG